MSISKRERMLIVVVVLLALLGAYYLYYLKPCLDDINELNADIAAKELQLATNEQQKKQLDQIDADIADLDEQLALFGGSVAQTFDQPPVLVYLTDTVRECGAAKGAINFREPEQVGQIERCTIIVAMTATYDGLKKVLDALQDAPYLIRVTQLTVVIPTAQDIANATTTDDGSATDPATTQIPEFVPEVLNVTLTLDFFSLSGEIPEDATYAFDTVRQYGGDIFY